MGVLLVEISGNGRVLVITDLHGNWEDYIKYESIWNGFLEDDKNHVVITGDFIHPMGQENDGSIEILESIKDYFGKYTNFHVLLGNHEFSQLQNQPIYKLGQNQTKEFVYLVMEKFSSSWEKKLEEYLRFLDKLPVAVKTGNHVFISHAGPSPTIRNYAEVENIKVEGYLLNKKLDDLLWTRPEDYPKEQLERFLENVGCKVNVVGHTPVAGFNMVQEKQMILSSSFSLAKKAYLDLDLNKKIEKASDLIKMIKYLPNEKKNNI